MDQGTVELLLSANASLLSAHIVYDSQEHPRDSRTATPGERSYGRGRVLSSARPERTL